MHCAAYPVLAVTPANPRVVYGAVAVLALAAPTTNGLPLVKGVATWFTKNAGVAFGITLSGTSIAGALATPLLAYVIVSLGWRAGFLALFGLIALLGLPVIIGWFRERPQPRKPASGQKLEGSESEAIHEDPHTHPGVLLRDALRDKRYWLLVIALGSASIPIGGFVSQLQPVLGEQGLRPMAAAFLGTIFGLASGSSRIISGALLDRFNPSLVAGICLAIPALGAGTLAMKADGGIPWLAAAPAVVFLGLAQGAEGDFIAFFIRRLFGLRRFSVIYGTMGMVVSGGIGIGGLLFAGIFDVYGNYHMALYASVAVYLTAALVMLTIKVPPLAKVV